MATSDGAPRSREELVAALHRVQELIDKRDNDEAITLATSVRSECRRLTGRDSANAAWLASIAADNGGDPEKAYGLVSEALDIDPVCLPFDNSRNIILKHLRAVLIAPDRNAADPGIERTYHMLMNAGRADEACHLALTRHYVATGRLDEAFKMADALTELFPRLSEAWVIMADLARRKGDDDLARSCDDEARAAVGLFGTPYPNMPEARA
jgi:tetratricopeptide (TPR) repeat protein